ncbi:MAG: TonB-dependent receptor [Terracidiphilus sp.]
MRFLRHTFSVCIFVLCAFVMAGAQENAEIIGVVTDASGAAIPNASITITHIATGTVHTTRSGSTGLFSFPALQIGIYNLTATGTGFKTYQKSGLVVNTAQTLRADVLLEVGAANQTVTVEANALQVQTDTNEVSTVVTGEQVLQLATNGRNMMSLTALGTGVTNTLPAFNGVSAQGSSAEINFNGMRYDHNNWLIDGGEVYDRGSGGRLDVAISPDALAQFQVLASNYTPDFGINSGGTVAMVLRSGTQKFHGALWEFNRNDAFSAGYYFFKQQNIPTPELRLNIFGGNIGGPLFIPHVYNTDRKKTFFFVNEEWRRYIQGANPSVTNTIPAAFFPTAGSDLSYAPLSGNPLVVPATSDPAKLAMYGADGLTAGQPFHSAGGSYTIPANLLDPNAVLFMGTGALPKPNTANGTQYIASPNQPTYVREDVVRIDHHFNDKYALMGHWIHDSMTQTVFPSMWDGDNYVTVGSVFDNPTWGAVVRLTQTISPTLLNETSFNVNGNTIDITPTGIYAQPAGWTAQGIFNGNQTVNRMPSITFSGSPNTEWNVNYWPWHNSYLNYQPRDDLAWSRGNHQFKFGAAYMRNDKNQEQQANTQGDYVFSQSAYSGDAYANFLLGFASSFQQLNQQSTFHWINNTYSFYAQDDWHVKPRLTLNLGIRYDMLPHVYEKDNRTSNFLPDDFSLANAQLPNLSTGALDPTGPGFSQPAGAPVPFYLNGVQLAGQNGFPRGIVQNHFGTVQPRVGFAYDLDKGHRTVLRGGWGLFYERVQGNDIYGTDVNPPNAYQPSVSAVYFSNPNTSNRSGLTATAPFFPGGFNSLQYTYPNPATQQFSLGLQREMAPSVIAQVQYVGMTAWHQNVQRAVNTLPLADVADRESVATVSGTNANLYRQFPGFAGITQVENSTNSTYNSLQTSMRMENRHGLTLQLSYTWSHEIDIQSGDLGSTNQQGSGGLLSNPFNTLYDRGSGTIDRRNVFGANYIYNFPTLRGSSTFTHVVLGGWVFSGITQATSGNPVNVTYSPDTIGLGGGTVNRPDFDRNQRHYPKTQLAWFNTGAYAAPVAPWAGGLNNGFGNASKDTIVGPGLVNWNLSLFKNFPLTPGEGARIQLRFETYNAFNHTQFQNINTTFTDSNFGQVTSTSDPRTWQFAGKFIF